MHVRRVQHASPSSASFGPELVDMTPVARCQFGFVRSRAKLEGCRPSRPDSGPRRIGPGTAGASVTSLRVTPSKVGQIRPESSWPENQDMSKDAVKGRCRRLAQLGRCWTSFCRSRANVVGFRANAGRFRVQQFSNLMAVLPELVEIGQGLVDSGKVSSFLEQVSSTPNICSSMFAKVDRSAGGFQATSVELCRTCFQLEPSAA